MRALRESGCSIEDASRWVSLSELAPCVVRLTNFGPVAVQVAEVVVDDVPVDLLGLRVPFDQVDEYGLQVRREYGRGDEAGNGGWRLVMTVLLGVPSG